MVFYLILMKSDTFLGGCSPIAFGREGNHAEQEDKTNSGYGWGEGNTSWRDTWPQGHAGCEGAEG